MRTVPDERDVGEASIPTTFQINGRFMTTIRWRIINVVKKMKGG
jgi:hypothetical protein